MILKEKWKGKFSNKKQQKRAHSEEVAYVYTHFTLLFYRKTPYLIHTLRKAFKQHQFMAIHRTVSKLQ